MTAKEYLGQVQGLKYLIECRKREIEYWNRKEPVMMEMILDGVFIERRDKSDTMQYCSFKERYCIGTKPIKKNENAE